MCLFYKWFNKSFNVLYQEEASRVVSGEVVEGLREIKLAFPVNAYP